MVKKSRTVNQALGMSPRFGPLPADQVIPWMAIAFCFYFFFREICHLDWTWVIVLILWGCSTWWMLTGSHSWRFLGKFVPVPSWVRGRVRYSSLLLHLEQKEEMATQRRKALTQRKKSKKSKSRMTRSAKGN